jgi:hypothetical protein
VKYDDEVKAEILKRLNKGSGEDINFVPFGKYAKQ